VGIDSFAATYDSASLRQSIRTFAKICDNTIARYRLVLNEDLRISST